MPNRRYLCTNCVGEEYLKSEIARTGKVRVCTYCRQRAASLTLEDIAQRIEIAFDQHYELTVEVDFDGDNVGEAAQDAISIAARIDDKPASDVLRILGEKYSDPHMDEIGEATEFSSESHYQRKSVDGEAFEEDWSRFERSLKSEARYFSNVAAEVLASIFDDVADAKTVDGRSVLMLAGPSTQLPSLYRARVFQSQEKLQEGLKCPELEIAPPPSRLARAGRMNAAGIPVFYGSTDPNTAMAEVRPPVGSSVIIGRFDILKPIRLLDVTALSRVFVEGSIFDRGYADRANRARFLEKLSRRVVRPVMPDDEVFEYLVTQVMADYLAEHPRIDVHGIYFPSVQVRGHGANVVLFHKSARTGKAALPAGSEVSVFLHVDEDSDMKYIVREKIHRKKESLSMSSDHLLKDTDTILSFLDEDDDHRPLMLELDLRSVVVHAVAGVAFQTIETPVVRTRTQPGQRDDF